MISELMNYGILGIWTATLLYDKWKFQKDMKRVIQDNTNALNKLEMRLR